MGKVTLNILRKTKLFELYQKLLLGKNLSTSEAEGLLEIAVILLNAEDADVQKLGYRIAMLYCNYSQNYIPLYDISLNKGLIPVAKFIESKLLTNELFEESFFRLFQSAYKRNFEKDGVYLTEDQLLLNSEFSKDKNGPLVVVAPTSYGKSDLMISEIANEKDNICILVPTKALIAQTKRRILNSPSYRSKRKIITHPEMFNSSDASVIAVLTQERALRLLQQNYTLKFNLVMIDEAHNLLDGEQRSRLLASSIILLKNRNKKARFKFLTPFLLDPENLNVAYTDFNMNFLKADEYLKSEKLFHYDFREESGLEIYDQFFDEHVKVGTEVFKDDVDLILSKKAHKNIIYLNKPSAVQGIANRLTSKCPKIESQDLQRACTAIANYVHKDYFLVRCLERGVPYHHGSVPDSIKLYIEHLFSRISEIPFIATTSTLLEGVNIPAEALFILDNKKGRSKLSPSQFKNLIGRVCRFSEIFHAEMGSLKMLEPSIYLVASSYMSKAANIRNFLAESMKVDRKIKEVPENVLLDKTELKGERVQERLSADEFLANLEPGVIDKEGVRYAETEFGRLCFAHSIFEIDILSCEEFCQEEVERILETEDPASDANGVMDLINKIFLPYVEDSNLKRLREEKARSFYSMFLKWRIENVSFGQMIGSFLGYWVRIEKTDPIIFVGSKWGDTKREESGPIEMWVDIRTKSTTERVNLAIVRIKEEQDFIDNELSKFIEVFFDLKLIEQKTYEEIKYGTSDPQKITMMKNGISPSLATLLLNKYGSHITVNQEQNTIEMDSGLHELMIENEENDLLVFELSFNVKHIKSSQI